MLCTCGKEFESKYHSKRYCTPDCYKTSHIHRLKALCHRAKTRSKEYNIPYNIDRDYIISLWNAQEGLCAITKRPFDLTVKKQRECVRPNSLSLDRITPKLGYIKGNLRLVTFQINCALNAFGDEALISMCKDILKHNAS